MNEVPADIVTLLWVVVGALCTVITGIVAYVRVLLREKTELQDKRLDDALTGMRQYYDAIKVIEAQTELMGASRKDTAVVKDTLNKLAIDNQAFRERVLAMLEKR